MKPLSRTDQQEEGRMPINKYEQIINNAVNEINSLDDEVIEKDAEIEALKDALKTINARVRQLDAIVEQYEPEDNENIIDAYALLMSDREKFKKEKEEKFQRLKNEKHRMIMDSLYKPKRICH